MTESGGRLSIIVAAWTALYRGDPDGLERILDDGVVWQGLLPELACEGRAEVMRRLGRLGARPPRITRLEAQESGRRVAVAVEGPDFPATDATPAGAPRALVFVFADESVTRIESYPRRDEAFAALGRP